MSPKGTKCNYIVHKNVEGAIIKEYMLIAIFAIHNAPLNPQS